MGLKKLVSRKVKQARRERQDVKEFDSVGGITDDKLRREVGSLVKDLKVVDGNYLKFVKKHSPASNVFSKDFVVGLTSLGMPKFIFGYFLFSFQNLLLLILYPQIL